MFQKGAAPRDFSYKEEALKLIPGAKCRAKESMGKRGYVVVLPDG